MGKLRDRAAKIARRLFRDAGLEVFGRRSMPYGCDFTLDLKRLSRAWSVPIQTIFDVGANIGQSSLQYSAVFPEARVYAFEPLPETAAALREATAALPNLTVVETALGPNVGTAEFFVHDLSVFNSLVPDNPFAVRYGCVGQGRQCPVVTLDHFCGENRIERIDLLKIDTEGYDLPILQGAVRLLESGAIKFVFVEFNDIQPIPGTTGGALAPICEFLRPYGFRFVTAYTDYVETGEHYVNNRSFVICNALLVKE
jgi:FkbM family methyltransferase